MNKKPGLKESSRPLEIKKASAKPVQKVKEKKPAFNSTDILALESLLFSLQYLNLKQKVVVNIDLSELRALKEIEKQKQKLEAELEYLDSLTNIDYNLMKMVQDNMVKYSALQNFIDLHSKMVSESELEEFKEILVQMGIRDDWHPVGKDEIDQEQEYQLFKSQEDEIQAKLDKQEQQQKSKIATLLYLNKPN